MKYVTRGNNYRIVAITAASLFLLCFAVASTVSAQDDTANDSQCEADQAQQWIREGLSQASACCAKEHK